LFGKRFVVASEGERGHRLAESKIKTMTGGDRIACRPLYKDLFEYIPEFKLWLATALLAKFNAKARPLHATEWRIRDVASALRASKHAISVRALGSRDLFLQNVPVLRDFAIEYRPRPWASVPSRHNGHEP
jgi:hypothetical protein